MCNINNKSHTPPTLKNPGSFDTKIANKKKTYKVYCWMRSANLERNMTSTVKTDDAMHTVAFPKTRSTGGKKYIVHIPSIINVYMRAVYKQTARLQKPRVV